MATTIVMPQLASTMENGTIAKWLKQVGDKVSEGEAIMEITTDKVDVEVESPAAGILLKILAKEGDDVPVKEPVGIIGTSGEEIGDVAAAVKEEKATEPSKIAEQPVASTGKLFASPRARRMAKEAGIDVFAVTGTGPGGRIVGRDIKNAKEGKKAEKPSTGQLLKPSAIQKVVAERLTMSYRTAPHIDLLMDVNCERIIALRTMLRGQGINVSYNDFLAKYVSILLRQFPKFNSTYGDDGTHLIDDVNIGIAAAVGEDLIVPVVKNVDKKNIKEIAAESARLIAAARDRKLSLDDLSGGTFTITNLGMYGIRSFKAIINPPQVAILAVGTIEPRAIVVPGQIIAQQMMSVSLSIDHRVVNGAQGGEFLARLKDLIETASLDILMNRSVSI